MNLKSALRNISSLQSIVIAMLASNFILAVGVVYFLIASESERERIVLIPPHMDNKAVIAWDAANAEYYKSFGLYVATMVANLQPKTATAIVDSVSTFFDSSIYTEFRQQSLAIVDDPVLRQSGTVIVFSPNSIAYEQETRRVFVTGNLITKSNAAERQKTVTYEVGLVMREGRPWVRHFTSYEGSILRTVSWHLNASKGDMKAVPMHAIPSAIKNEEKNGDEDDLIK
jgi:conjugal transfer pilus assembly protein TraE